MPLPQDFLDELHSRNDISEVIGSYISLIGRGRTSKALCPFHSEKTPSFTVFGDTQSFFCFGCNTGGDVISFVMKLDNLSYIEAVRKLADRVNLKMPEDVNDDNAKLRMRIYAANKKAARFFFDHLNSDDGRNARSYLRQRGLQDNFIAKFGLGFSPTGWSDLRDFLRKEGFYDRELLAAGLIAEGKSGTYDVFRSRIMIPIIDIRGNVIAFGGRALGDTGPKYINTSDTPVFKKSRNLFALNIAKGLSRELILAEGYMDVIMLHQAGFTGSVATLGTALTVEQTRLISQYADEVLICYDSDEAGKRATKRAIDLCRQIGLSVRVVDYTGAKDPDEYIRKFGSKAFNELLIKSKNSLEYELNKAKDKYPISTDEGKVRYLSEASMILAGSTSPTEIDIYASKLSNEFSVGKEAIMAQVSDIRKRRRRNNSKKFLESLSDINRQYDVPKSQTTSIGAASAERHLVLLLYKNPDLWSKVKGRVTKEDFYSTDIYTIYTTLTEAIENGTYKNISSLTEKLPDKLMSALVGLVHSGPQGNYSQADADYYIEKMKNTAGKPDDENIMQMDIEELQKLIESKK